MFAKGIRAFGLLGMVGLSGCIGEGTIPLADRDPALTVLALDYERTVFAPGAAVRGSVAVAQRDRRISTATWGRFRSEAKGPIPTEVLIEATRLVTNGRQVEVEGTLKLRDLAFGTIIAEQEGFRATGTMPSMARGGTLPGLVFRGIEADVLAWISELECNTDARVCGERIAAASEIVVSAGADLDLSEMVENRRGGLTNINQGGIDAGQVVAAATPATDGGGATSKIGTTVAALGLLDRSGFWLQTPLVSTEAAGAIVDPATGKRVAVTLIPKDGPAGGGSQISLAALTELGLDMTALVTLEVFR